MTLIKNEKDNLEFFQAEVDSGNFDKNDYHYSLNIDKFIDQCCICGKGIKNHSNTFTTRGYGNPLFLVHKKDHTRLETELLGADMGCYYLGSECGKQIKKQLIDAGLNWKDYLSK